MATIAQHRELTEDQQRMVEEQAKFALGFANVSAKRVAGILHWLSPYEISEDLESRCLRALCEAAAVYRHDPEKGGHFKGFAAMCMQRTVSKYVRDQVAAKRRWAMLPIVDDEDFCQPAPRFERNVIGKVMLEVALVKLPPICREAFARYVGGESMREVSERLGVPTTTVGGRVTSCQRILRSWWRRDVMRRL